MITNRSNSVMDLRRSLLDCCSQFAVDLLLIENDSKTTAVKLETNLVRYPESWTKASQEGKQVVARVRVHSIQIEQDVRIEDY